MCLPPSLAEEAPENDAALSNLSQQTARKGSKTTRARAEGLGSQAERLSLARDTIVCISKDSDLERLKQVKYI